MLNGYEMVVSMQTVNVGSPRPPTEVIERCRQLEERDMKDDDRPLTQDWLEKQMGHKAYGHMRNWGSIALWLLLIVVVCGFILFWVFGE